MKKLFTLVILAGLLVAVTGCESKEDKLAADKKTKRDYMKQKINSKSNNAPTKLPL